MPPVNRLKDHFFLWQNARRWRKQEFFICCVTLVESFSCVELSWALTTLWCKISLTKMSLIFIIYPGHLLSPNKLAFLGLVSQGSSQIKILKKNEREKIKFQYYIEIRNYRGKTQEHIPASLKNYETGTLSLRALLTLPPFLYLSN